MQTIPTVNQISINSNNNKIIIIIIIIMSEVKWKDGGGT